MEQLEIIQLTVFAVLLVSSAVVVFTSLSLARRGGGTVLKVPSVSHRRRKLGSLARGFNPSGASSARQGGQILEYLGKLAQDFEPIATDEEIATPRGAVAIPMAIAVRGEVRVLYPLESSLSAERIDETLRKVALIRRHRFPEARIAFLSERSLPLELALCASPENTLGKLIAQTALHMTELREGHDDATVFREVFHECTGLPLAYSVEDLERVDAFLAEGEPVSGPITYGLRRLGKLLGSYLEWVLAGLFSDRLQREEGRVVIALDGGNLDLDPASLALESLYGAGRVPLAGLVRDLTELSRDPFHIPSEVSPAILQRFPNSSELARYRRPTALENALVSIKKRRLEMMAVSSQVEEVTTVYLCSCGAVTMNVEVLGGDEDAPCRTLAELESRLMEALQEASANDAQRCDQCFGRLGGRDLRLVSTAHPMVDRGLDLWVTLDRLPSGKFWWHLTRLRSSGDVTHYSSVLTHSTFRRAFGRFFSTKEAWAILFQRVSATLREERLRAEPGLVLFAAPDGLPSRVPSATHRVGRLSPRLVIPLTNDAPPTLDPAEESFLKDERELRALGMYGRPPVAWVVAWTRPFQKVFEREVVRQGGRFRRRGLSYRILKAAGGESHRDLARVISRTCLDGRDYLMSARLEAGDAVREATETHAFIRRAQEVLGEGVQIRYRPERGELEVGEGAGEPARVQLRTLIAKSSVEDGSFERFLRMAISRSDLGVGLDVCGCGERAFVSRKLRPRGWRQGPGDHDDLARQSLDSACFVFSRDCVEHNHYLSLSELSRIGLGMEDLEARYQRDLDEQRFKVTLRAVRVDAHLFFAVAGPDSASVAGSGELTRGLLDDAEVELDSPTVRFLATASGCLVLGEPEAPPTAFQEAARVAESLLREREEVVEPLRYEGLLNLPEVGRGSFELDR